MRNLQKKVFINEIIAPACNHNPLIINAFESIPRERFLDDAFKFKAYKDMALPIGHHQTISKPSTVAKMLSYLNIHESLNVLEIGTGSGYQTALLSKIFLHIYTIEILPNLYAKASKILKSLYIGNVTFKIGNGYNGLPEYAPFDNIIISAELPKIPDPLIKQLKIGGVIIAPCNGYILKVVKKDNFDARIEKLDPCKFVNFVLE
jgi:protein-L-isoaspartate(D-aspartate) O-methyltransferase